MATLVKPHTPAFHLPRWRLPRFISGAHKRRRVTIDLINASPHLLRDIGVVEGKVVRKGR